MGFDYFKIGSIESREGPTEQPLGTFDARDILVYGAVAVPVSERLSLGARSSMQPSELSRRRPAPCLLTWAHDSDRWRKCLLDSSAETSAAVPSLSRRNSTYRSRSPVELILRSRT